MSEAAYGDASALHARRVPLGRAPRVCRLGFSQMSSAALPGAHAGADASSARGDPSEEETGETVPDGDVDASTSVSRERERDAPSDVGLVAIGGLRALRARSGSFARGGVRGLLPSKAQSRTRALASAPAWWSPYAFAARMTLAFSFSASAGLAPGGGSFGRGGGRGVWRDRDDEDEGAPREAKRMVRPEGARANRGFAIRVSRSVASSRGMGGAKTVMARGRASRMGRSPGGAQPRASGRARKGSRTARDARPRHPRAHDRDREKRIARSRRDRNGGGRRNARWVCASRNVCVEAFICLVTREPSGRARRGALDARPMRARIGNGGDELGEKNASTFLALRAHSTRNYRCRIRNGECARVERGILFRETGCKFTNNACENAGRRDSFARALPSYFEVHARSVGSPSARAFQRSDRFSNPRSTPWEPLLPPPSPKPRAVTPPGRRPRADRPRPRARRSAPRWRSPR